MNGIELPKAMRTLPRDRRGYPIPFIVLVDDAGRPHFTVNDVRKSAKALRGKLCAMCGKRMTEGYWFIGGPGSALHPNGRYLDSPAHEDCARFAMRVCPYLAAPRYGRRIEGRTIDPADMPRMLIAYDASMDDRRPPLFCLGHASGYRSQWGDGQLSYIEPVRPWLALEYWRQGKQLDPAEAAPIAAEAVRSAHERAATTQGRIDARGAA